jgi:hypothetical protein
MSNNPQAYTEVLSLFVKHFEDGLYDEVASDVNDMGTSALAGAEYNNTFHRVIEQWSNNYLYRNSDGIEFHTNIVGEICPKEQGTLIGAKGNHYGGRPGQLVRFIDVFLN